jgi:adenosylcobinamide kinase/adenosylcobinamide-phosphate guanylyltransferase
VTRVLVLGGARSGKSGFAESLVADAAQVEYVATGRALPDDAEWTERIRVHQARRPAGWRTTETGDLAAVLSADGPPVLLDSITTWLSGLLEAPDVDRATDALVAAWAACTREVVAVSDEVGLGVVPATEQGRDFRDRLGALNQRLAAGADEVHLVVAGIPMRLR